VLAVLAVSRPNLPSRLAPGLLDYAEQRPDPPNVVRKRRAEQDFPRKLLVSSSAQRPDPISSPSISSLGIAPWMMRDWPLYCLPP
jgi:hypothetical protein